MNSLVATPPIPPHFHEHSRFNSPSRFVPSMNQTGSRKRKAEDDHGSGDHDTRMSASPTHSPALLSRPLGHRHIKRARPNISGRPLSVGRLLETLDSESLRSVLRTLCDRHPELGQEVVDTAPRPNVTSALQVLTSYQSTLQAAFPLGGNPSSDYAYNRVRPHVMNLLDALNDFTPHFLPPNESLASTSLSYLDGVTEIIHHLPRWDTPHYNLEKETAYEEIARAWALVIREASKRGGGIQLQIGEWDQKLLKHNATAGGKLQEAVGELSSILGWMAGSSVAQHASGGHLHDSISIRQQLLSGTYGAGLPLKVGNW